MKTNQPTSTGEGNAPRDTRSPLPWRIDIAHKGMIRDAQDTIVAEGLSPNDAKFIVKTCNQKV